MKRLFWSASISLIAVGAAHAQEREEARVRVIANASIRSEATIDQQTVPMAGRVSLMLEATEKELAEDVIRVEGLNLAFLEVPMEPFMRRANGDRVRQEGLVGFTPDNGAQKVQIFRQIVPGWAVMFGQIRGSVELSALGDMMQVPTGTEKDQEPVFTAPTLPAVLALLVLVEEKNLLEPGAGAGAGENGILEHPAALYVAFTTDALSLEDVEVPAFMAAQPALSQIDYQITWLNFESVRQLCVQPVRIGVIQIESGWPFPLFTVKFTGKGLPFGQPGANTQWRKGDVIFEWRPFVTLWKPQYFTLDIAAGEDVSLRNELSVSDCIEVFFVDGFDTPSTWGGGATFSSGLASAKVISSDDNAEPVCAGGACNVTHLAHELGHVMTLHHPGVGGLPAYMVNGTWNTLMCPSGFTADNPRRNSLNNENNVNNPLFQYKFAIAGPPPDCTDDINCGLNTCSTITTP